MLEALRTRYLASDEREWTRQDDRHSGGQYISDGHSVTHMWYWSFFVAYIFGKGNQGAGCPPR